MKNIGGTPLFRAAQHNHAFIVQQLIKYNANIFAQHSTRETALEIACLKDSREAIEVR